MIAIVRVEFFQRFREPVQVLFCSGVNDIQIESCDRRTKQYRAHTADDDELNLVARKHLQDG